MGKKGKYKEPVAGMVNDCVWKYNPKSHYNELND